MDSDKPISKNEFYLVQQNVSDRIKNVELRDLERNKDVADKLDLILIQTTKTNGSVRSLQIWRSFITGGLAIIAVFLIPILLYIIQSYLPCHVACPVVESTVK